MVPPHKVCLRIWGTPKECDEERVWSKGSEESSQNVDGSILGWGNCTSKGQIQENTNTLEKVHSLFN